MQQSLTFVFDCLATLSSLWSTSKTPRAARENLARSAEATLTNRIEIPMALADAVYGENVDDQIDIDLIQFGVTVALSGKPKPVAPIIHFRFKADAMSWQVGRAAPRDLNLAPLAPTSTFTLNCPVCGEVDMATLTSPPIHATLKHWASVQMPCCETCSRRVSLPDDMPPGGCFCCFSRPATKSLQRDDNAVVLMVCDTCDRSQWLKLIREAGMVFCERDLVSPRVTTPVEHVLCSHPNEITRAYTEAVAAEAVAAKSPAKKVAVVNEPQPDNNVVVEPLPVVVPASSSVLQCSDCAGTPIVCCREVACVAALCMDCMKTRYGSIARIYRNAPWWVCDEHRK